jgi:AcrR family transcriptional regulator
MPEPVQSPDPTTAARGRHDAFDGARKRLFLDALGKGGCLRDAARRAGVSHQTVYNHQRSDPTFARQCELALSMASTDLELHAWERAVHGVEEPVYQRGEQVGTRLKRSDAMLRMLLQAAKPKKYGPNPGFKRKRVLKAERHRIAEEARRELRDELKAAEMKPDEVTEKLMANLDRMARGMDARRIRDGWTKLGEDGWAPPGYRWAGAGPDPYRSGSPKPDLQKADLHKQGERRDDSV